MPRLIVFGAGGLAAQIIDTVPADTSFATDRGGGLVYGRSILRFDPTMAGHLVIAVNSLDVRRRIASVWLGELGRVVAASAEVSPYASLGGGAIICRQAIVEAGVSAGSHAQINDRATVGHGSQLGDFCTVGPAAVICGDCRIGDGVRIGAGAIIREGTTIGDGAFVGMGSLVSKDIPAGVSVICGRVLRGSAPLPVAA